MSVTARCFIVFACVAFVCTVQPGVRANDETGLTGVVRLNGQPRKTPWCGSTTPACRGLRASGR